MTRAGRVLVLTLVTAALSLTAARASAHHVGAYTPRDNDISANFKQLKFAIQAGKFDVARELFRSGAVRREMQALAARLPARLDERVAAALRDRDGAAAERGLMVFFAALARDLAVEAERRVTDPSASAETREAAGRKLLEAIWRYYSLVDFVVSQADPKTAVAVRLAFDEAETFVKGTAAPAAVNPCTGPKPAAPGGKSGRPERMAEPVRRIAQVLGALIEASPTARRE